MQVSLIASSVRTHLYDALCRSLSGTSVTVEIVFTGNAKNAIFNLRGFDPESKNNFEVNGASAMYCNTSNIKPAQCYEIARRNATGEVVCWMADDCLFPDDVLGKAYRFWKSLNNEKAIISMHTKERYTKDYFFTNLDDHRLNGPKTPLMAPIGMMSRGYLQSLSGFDKRYICGQYENDVVMRILEDGGELVKFEEASVIIDHYIGHGGVTTEEGYKRPFAQGYVNDRTVLLRSWTKQGLWLPGYKRFDKFEPYDDVDIMTKSQSNTIKEIWGD